MDALAASGVTSLFVFEDPLTASLRTIVVTEANRLRLPTMSGLPEYARVGGLMTYGTGRNYQYRRTAEYVDKILRGAKPGDLPVEQPTQFHLVINVKTAKALDVAIPPSLLAIADEVIE